MNRLPYLYQLQGVHAMHRMRDPQGNVRALLADAMGLGKTYQSMMMAAKHHDWRPMIVVCPASLKHQWLHEITIATGERAEMLSTRTRRKGKIDMTAPIVVINYDILKDWLPFLKRLKAKYLIIDEGHFCQSRTAKRTRAVKSLSKIIPNMVVLTGTPLTNRPAEIWAILHCLRPDLYPSFLPFAWEHCGPKKNNFGVWEYKGAVALDVLHNNLKRNLMVRRLKADVIDQLPKKRRVVVPVDLSSRIKYDKIANDFRGWLTDLCPGKMGGAARAAGLVRTGHLKRMAAKLKMPSVFEWIDNFLQESDGKLIVFGIHRKIVQKVHDRYGNSVLVNGSVTGDKRNLAVRKFQTDPRCRIFVGNIQAAGVGLNLTAADTVLFIEFGWKPGEHVQAEDRAYARVGDMHGATIYYLVGRDTIEETLVQLIQKKQKVIDAVLDNGKTPESFDLLTELFRSLRRKMKVAA